MHLLGGIGLGFAMMLTNQVTGSPTWWYPVAVVAFNVIKHPGWMVERSMGARH